MTTPICPPAQNGSDLTTRARALLDKANANYHQTDCDLYNRAMRDAVNIIPELVAEVERLEKANKYYRACNIGFAGPAECPHCRLPIVGAV